jgi:hypothetical protein
VDGKLTDKMCGLLTPADYRRYGHNLLPEAGKNQPAPGGQQLSCLYMTGDELTLGLQPTAEAAKLAFDAEQSGHTSRIQEDHKTGQLSKDVVSGADQSWFDISELSSGDQYPEYALSLRRGALLVGLHLTVLDKAKGKAPQETLVGLAGLVLQRVPDLGKADTGTTLKVHYEVSGKGKAQTVDYADPTANKSVHLSNVNLPWSIDVPMATPYPGASVVVQVNATQPMTLGSVQVIGCRVLVGGKVVINQPPGAGLALCTGTYSTKES